MKRLVEYMLIASIAITASGITGLTLKNHAERSIVNKLTDTFQNIQEVEGNTIEFTPGGVRHEVYMQNESPTFPERGESNISLMYFDNKPIGPSLNDIVCVKEIVPFNNKIHKSIIRSITRDYYPNNGLDNIIDELSPEETALDYANNILSSNNQFKSFLKVVTVY